MAEIKDKAPIQSNQSVGNLQDVSNSCRSMHSMMKSSHSYRWPTQASSPQLSTSMQIGTPLHSSLFSPTIRSTSR